VSRTYLDGLVGDDFVKAFVERRELTLDRLVQVPVHVQVDELLLVLVGDRDARASSLELGELLHSEIVVAGAESKVHRLDVVRLLDVAQGGVEIRFELLQVLELSKPTSRQTGSFTSFL
jgi:hypothetical protein